MSKVWGVFTSSVKRWSPAGNRLLLMGVALSLAACNQAPKPSLQTYASPGEAGEGLLSAAKTGDLNAVQAIFGKDSKDVLFSGDIVQDKATVGSFVTGYEQMHRWRSMADGTQTLLIGAQNFAFPLPLKKNDQGQWFFDTVAGKEEIVRRRIGRNELAVIDICQALGDAQTDYHSRRLADGSTNQYAVKFISDAGKQNGLYWESAQDQPRSPLGPMLVYATSEGYSVKPNAHVPFHGYYFRMLQGQGANAPGGARDYVVDGRNVGGFAFVAYPAEYGNSGIMTFTVDQDGVILQKNLGQTTVATASAMSSFNPDSSWKTL